MLINIKVVPRSSRNFVKEENGLLKVYVNAPAQKGKANEAVVELIAGHFGVKKRQVSILKGELSPRKIISIVK